MTGSMSPAVGPCFIIVFLEEGFFRDVDGGVGCGALLVLTKCIEIGFPVFKGAS
jgi:hypothetical protein